MFEPLMSAEAITAFWHAHFPQARAGRDHTILRIGPGEAVLV